MKISYQVHSFIREKMISIHEYNFAMTILGIGKLTNSMKNFLKRWIWHHSQVGCKNVFTN